MTDDAETIRALKSVDAYRDQVDRIREELGAAPDEPAIYAAKALRKRAEKAEAQLEALRADCFAIADRAPAVPRAVTARCVRTAATYEEEPTDAD